MTPEKAEEIFYQAYREEQLKQHMDWSKPLVQKEVRMKSYEALIKAIKKEVDYEWANKYLALSKES